MGQYKLIGRMHTLAPWANTSVLAECRPIRAHQQDAHIGAMGQYKRVGRMQARRQDAHIGAMGQYKPFDRIQAAAPWANTSSSAGCTHRCHGPIQAFWKNAGASTMGQYRLIDRMHTLAPWANTSVSAECRLIDRMHTLAPWANTSLLTEYRRQHHGPIRACRQDARISAMGQYEPFDRIQAAAPWANTSSSAGCTHQRHRPIQACRQDAHIGAMGQYTRVGRMQNTGGSTTGQYKLIGRMHTSAPLANTSFSEEHMYEHCGPIQACRQDAHIGAMGQYKRVGRMQNTCMSNVGQNKLIARMHILMPSANMSFSVTVPPSPACDSPCEYTPTTNIPFVASANTPEDPWWDWQAEEDPRVQERVWAAIEALEDTARAGRLVLRNGRHVTLACDLPRLVQKSPDELVPGLV
ncbi:hypothetical protein EDB85DRAFT_1892241 [Lactarius pseudohatsudake]|nr:hypothetical protein EDB85DRAFT_1892241 [Lactarius pseudohatsudake]